jgi:hypothetical protein
MIVGPCIKQPFEVIPISVDFVLELLRDNDTILTQTVTARNADTGVDSGLDILLGSPLLGDSVVLQNGVPIRSETRVVQRVRLGNDGERHLLTFRVITALGLQWEGDVYLLVQES